MSHLFESEWQKMMRGEGEYEVIDSHPGFGWDTRNRYSSARILTGNWQNERENSAMIGGISSDRQWMTTTQASFSPHKAYNNAQTFRDSLQFNASMSAVNTALKPHRGAGQMADETEILSLSGSGRSFRSGSMRSNASSSASSSRSVSRPSSRGQLNTSVLGMPTLTSTQEIASKTHRGKIPYHLGRRFYDRHKCKWVPEPVDEPKIVARTTFVSTRRREDVQTSQHSRFSTTMRSSYTNLPPISGPQHGRITTPITASEFRNTVTRGSK